MKDEGATTHADVGFRGCCRDVSPCGARSYAGGGARRLSCRVVRPVHSPGTLFVPLLPTPLARAFPLARTRPHARFLAAPQVNELNQLLRTACQHNKYREVGRLLEAGAQAAHCDSEGFTPIHAASTTGSVKLLKRLVKAGADAAVTDKVARCWHPHRWPWLQLTRACGGVLL